MVDIKGIVIKELKNQMINEIKRNVREYKATSDSTTRLQMFYEISGKISIMYHADMINVEELEELYTMMDRRVEQREE